MPGAIRFGWIGESRRATLYSLLMREACEWSRDWWMAHSVSAIDVRPLDEWPGPKGKGADTAHRLGDGLLWLSANVEAGVLGAYLAGHRGGGNSVLAAKVGESALADFADRLARHSGVAVRAMDTGDDAGEGRKLEFGSYMAAVFLGDHGFHLAMDRALVDGLAPVKTHAGTSLVPRAKAVGSRGIPLEACLSLGTTPLSGLDDLKVGEVLVGDSALGEPLALRLVGGDTVAYATLGRDGPRRAVTLIESF